MNTPDTGCKNLMITSKKQRIELNARQYLLTENKVGFKLTILDKQSLGIIKTMDNPVLLICFNNKKIEARGNPIFSSSIPKGAEIFFALSNDNKIYFSNKNEILISLINKVTGSQKRFATTNNQENNSHKYNVLSRVELNKIAEEKKSKIDTSYIVEYNNDKFHKGKHVRLHRKVIEHCCYHC